MVQENEKEVGGTECACSGIRSCLICERKPTEEESQTSSDVFWHCPQCDKLFQGDISGTLNNTISYTCSIHENEIPTQHVSLEGIKVFTEFISCEEEQFLIEQIDTENWKLSQSGRRKQDFGPQINFKRKKVKMGNFSGLPPYCKNVVDRMCKVANLTNFIPVELCNLEYMCERGSSIDPHIDDTWIWGEQLVTLNLLSDTILTMTCPDKCPDNDYHAADKKTKDDSASDNASGTEVQVLMPARSLLVLEGDARFIWSHSVKREHITTRRLAMTFRNLSKEFLLEEKQQEIAAQLTDMCLEFRNAVSVE